MKALEIGEKARVAILSGPGSS
ncbi:unnamed protein product [Rhodiola kirilowii]